MHHRPRLGYALAALVFLLAAASRSFAEEAPDAATTSGDEVPASSSAKGPDSSVEEILVSGSSVASAVDQARFSESIVDVLSAKDFQATGDSRVVDALSRVTGVTTVGEKYVYVRGLGERYSNTLFNNATLPSPDPFRRVVPLNLFPSSVLQQLSVQKTYAPYLPADFAGGSVQLTTREVPTEREASMSVKTKVNSETTFQNRPWYDGGSSTDWTGFDGGYRQLSKAAKNLPSDAKDPQQIQQAGLSLHRRFQSNPETIAPGYGLNLSYANGWDTHVGNLGFVMGAETDNDWQYKKEKRITYGFFPAITDYKEEPDTENDIQQSALVGGTWKPAESQVVKATLFMTHLTQNEYYQQDPIAVNCGDYNTSPEECQYFSSLFSEWREESLITAQLSGNHALERYHDLGVDWGATFSNAKRSVPDSRYYGYYYPGLPIEGTSLFLNDNSNIRRWEDLNDDAWDAYLTLSLPMRWAEGFLSTLKAGGKFYDKKRDSRYQQYRYVTGVPAGQYDTLPIDEIFQDANINPNYWKLIHERFDSNNYAAEERIYAGFFQHETELGEHFRWMAGFRYEGYTQATITGTSPRIVLDEPTWSPATELTWLINDEFQLRGAYSRTVNRPDMLERVCCGFTRNPDNGYIYTGDPRNGVATLSNYDLRLEWYHGNNDSVELAGFYKDIQDPLEEVNFRIYRSWRNASDAKLYGVEVAMQQNLAPLGRWAEDFTLRGNGAWIESEVTPGTTDLQFTNPKHPLQGASPWVVNFQVAHEYVRWDLQTNLAFNWAGKRLSAIGPKPTPDSYEHPTPNLDFTLKKGFDLFGASWQFTFKARNLIDATFEETQDHLPIRSYHTGRDFTFEISRDF